MVSWWRHWWSPPDYRAMGLLDGSLGMPNLAPSIRLIHGGRYARRYEMGYVEAACRLEGVTHVADTLRLVHRILAP